MASEEAWVRGHKAALPWMRASALGGLMASLTLGGYALVTGLIIAAGTAANRAALKV